MRRLAALLLVACTHRAAMTANPAPSRVVDSAKHSISMVEVAHGVSLEVVDYGGSGDPIVFLAGLGNTAHVWDDFAPQFTNQHHVVAITRRGFGASSGPADGYDVPTRANDDVAVLDALHIDRAIFVGHSIAGDELTELAGAHPDRVRALVYIDAAIDHAKVRALQKKFPKNMDPDPPADAVASPAAFAAWLSRTYGFNLLFGETLASFDFGPDGHMRGPRGRPDVAGRILAATTSPDYTRVHAPALVLFAVPVTVEDIDPGFAKHTAADQKALRALWPEFVRILNDSRADVAAHLPGAKIVDYPHAQHYLFVQHAKEVAAEMRSFMP